jgi:hypothetical protein
MTTVSRLDVWAKGAGTEPKWVGDMAGVFSRHCVDRRGAATGREDHTEVRKAACNRRRHHGDSASSSLLGLMPHELRALDAGAWIAEVI